MRLLTVEGLPPRSGIRIWEGLGKSFTSFIVSNCLKNVCISQEINLKKLTSRKIKNQISKKDEAINCNNSRDLLNIYYNVASSVVWNMEKGKHRPCPKSFHM